MRNNSSAAVRLELEGDLFANVEAWRREQEKIPSRSSAVRQLIERALIRSSAGSEQQEKAHQQ